MSQALAAGTDVALASLGARAFEIPLDAPESDGTAEWDSTVMVVVEAHAGGETGLGYTYGSRACRVLVDELLAPAVVERDAFAVSAAWDAMVAACRNAGAVGAASMAIAAVDLALWDRAGRRTGRPVAHLLAAGAATSVPVNATIGAEDRSGAASAASAAARDGFRCVKVKVGIEIGRAHV